MNSTWRNLLRIVLALALLAGVAACGDDDDGSSTGSASGSGSGSGSTATEDEDDSGDDGDAASAEFCAALQTFHGKVFEIDIEDDPAPAEIQAAYDELDPIWSDVEANVPDELADDVASLGKTIDALGEGDAELFNADETGTTYFTMVGEALDGCVDEVVEVTAVDYAFTGVPETVPSGPIGLRLINGTDANEQHELIIFKKADGETRSAEELLNDPAAQEEGPGEFASAVFAGPGETSGTFLDLAPGDYIAVCFVPVGSGEHDMPEADDSVEDGGEDQATDDDGSGMEEEGPPHFTKGMVAEFSVA